MPASMRAAWAEELERWLPALHPGSIKMWCVLHALHLYLCQATQTLRSAGLDDTDGIDSARVFVVTYDLLTRGDSLRQRLLLTNPGVLIVDESHYCKNRDAKRTQVLPSPPVSRRMKLMQLCRLWHLLLQEARTAFYSQVRRPSTGRQNYFLKLI
jgi:hypothetical protein